MRSTPTARSRSRASPSPASCAPHEPRVYERPTKLATALEFVDGLAEQPTCVAVSARPDHRAIFRRVVTAADARGSLVPDAHLAAIAIEHGATSRHETAGLRGSVTALAGSGRVAGALSLGRTGTAG
jgi:hypothetical protein